MFTYDPSSLWESSCLPSRTEHQAGLWDGVDDPHFKRCGHGDGETLAFAHAALPSKAPVIGGPVEKKGRKQFSTSRFSRHDCVLVSCPVKSHSRVKLR